MDENFIISVLLRTGRSAAGWNQDDFAQLLGVAKSTVARVETMEMSIKADLYLKALKLFKEYGIEVEPLIETGEIAIKVTDVGMKKAFERMQEHPHAKARKNSAIFAERIKRQKDQASNVEIEGKID